VNIPATVFREYDIRGITGTQLTGEAARLIGRGYAAFIAEQGVSGTIAVGRDNRPSGDELCRSLVAGLTESGLDVIDIGMVPTPTAYWAQHTLDVAGGIQITGSHNPPEYNGFKLGLEKKSLWGSQIQHIRELIDHGAFPEGKGSVRTIDVIDDYLDDVVDRIGPILRNVKAVVDCGNGAGALVMPELLRRLGVPAECLFCESDGTFPNHHPDPTVEKNLQDLIRRVRETGSELGIALDGDADRIGIVDERGEIIWGDYLLILYARDVLERTGAGQSIIFDVKCSQALPDAIERAGGKPVMWRTGHSLIKEKMHETHAPVAGEMSGHMFFAEGYYGFDDAIYGAARLLRIVADADKSVRELLADVPRFVSTPEIRVECPDERKFGLVEKAKRHFASKYDVIDVDGVRVQFGDGWGLLRASNTQPVLVLRFEARSQAELERIRAEFAEWLAGEGVQL
jgi:phosphomannomutase / phosphoglucomutase